MLAPKGKRGRRTWRNIHLWIGLGLFVALAPLGLSGALLVWADSLDKLAHPARYAVTEGAAVTPGLYLDAASRAFGGRAVASQLKIPQAPGLPATVTGYRPVAAPPGQRPPSLTAWIDPGSGRVLDVADQRQELLGVIHRLHGNLLLPQNGRPVVGWLGVAMLVSSVTGLVLWWPRGNRIRRGLRWTRSSSVFSNVHHMAGFWICIPLAVLSFSGAYIAFPQALQGGGGPGRPAGSPGGGFAAPLAAPKTTIGQATRAASLAAGPSARLVSVNLPSVGAKPAWRFQFQLASGDPVSVRVDDASGRARVQPGRAEGPGGGDPIAGFMRRLHDGSGYGPLWQTIITLAGVAPTLLGLTGAVIWLNRRKITAG